jgi:hypothetical protein
MLWYKSCIFFERMKLGFVSKLLLSATNIITYVTIHKSKKIRNRKSIDSSDCLVTEQAISEVPSHIVMFTVT